MGPDDLAQVLRPLADRGSTDPNVLLGLDAPDDSAVYRLSDALAIVQSVDFFTPIVDDAYSWGAIAAANALSDIYAMGATPLIALNLVGWPREELGFEILGEVIRGAAAKTTEANVTIVGGHSIDDREPKFGMAVTGVCKPDEIITAGSAAPELEIVLTKPLGTGVISTAIKREVADEEVVRRAVDVMTKLNRDAAERMRQLGALAATDVTGFGLLGHLHHVCSSSGVGAEIFLEEIPILDGAVEYAAQGMIPGGTRRNESFYREFVEFAPGIDDVSRTLLFDAQTSGGLLVALEAGQSSKMGEAVIGRFVEGPPIIRVI